MECGDEKLQFDYMNELEYNKLICASARISSEKCDFYLVLVF